MNRKNQSLLDFVSDPATEQSHSSVQAPAYLPNQVPNQASNQTPNQSSGQSSGQAFGSHDAPRAPQSQSIPQMRTTAHPDEPASDPASAQRSPEYGPEHGLEYNNEYSDEYNAEYSDEYNAENHNENHTEYHGPRFDPDKPLLDPIILARAVWRKKYLIIAFGFVGAIIAMFVALATPHIYSAESQIFLDPREIQITDTPIDNNTASHQVLLAVVDSQTKVLTTTPVLDRVIDELGLTSDPEFNGTAKGGVFSAITDVISMFTGGDTESDYRQSALKYLRENVSVWRDPQTFVVYVGMKSFNPNTAAMVANSVVKQYLIVYSSQQTDFFDKTTTSIQSRLSELRSQLDAAERAVVQYRAQNDIIDVGGGVINEKEMLELSNELARVKAEQVTKTIAVGQLTNLDLDSVLSEAFPEAALGVTLVELRKQYSAAKSNSDSLSAALGPRHPQFISADAAVKALENDIRDELRRIISATQKDLSRARQSEGELASKLAVLKTKASTQSSETVGLRELERKAESIRLVYEALLSKSSETTVRGNLDTTNIQIISQADIPELPTSTSRKVVLVLGGILGGIIGFAIALISGAIESIKYSMNAKGSPPARKTNPAKRAARPQETNSPVQNTQPQAPAAHMPQTAQEAPSIEPVEALHARQQAEFVQQAQIQQEAQQLAQQLAQQQAQQQIQQQAQAAQQVQQQQSAPIYATPTPTLTPTPALAPTYQQPIMAQPVQPQAPVYQPYYAPVGAAPVPQPIIAPVASHPSYVGVQAPQYSQAMPQQVMPQQVMPQQVMPQQAMPHQTVAYPDVQTPVAATGPNLGQAQTAAVNATQRSDERNRAAADQENAMKKQQRAQQQEVERLKGDVKKLREKLEDWAEDEMARRTNSTRRF